MSNFHSKTKKLNGKDEVPQESKNLRVGLFLSGVLIIGVGIGAFTVSIDNDRQIEDFKKIIETNPQETNCPGLNSEDVKNIMYREIEDIIETRAVLDGAMGEATFVPMLKRIISPEYHKRNE